MKDKAIGVFDSGIGGLSVLKQFIRFLPYERYIYLGDTARVPYGGRSSDIVRQYARESTEFLLAKDVKMIVIACNTVSAVAVDTIRDIADVPVIEMITPAAKAAVLASPKRNIGVIGTKATIKSNAYTDAIFRFCDKEKARVYAQDCPLFVPIVEEGWEQHPASKLIAEDYLKELKQQGVDTLVLGCTHYPMLQQLIRDIMPGVSLIDSGEHAAVAAVRVLADAKALVEERNDFIAKPDVDFYVTDVPDTFYDLAQRFLGFAVNTPNKILAGKY